MTAFWKMKSKTNNDHFIIECGRDFFISFKTIFLSSENLISVFPEKEVSSWDISPDVTL